MKRIYTIFLVFLYAAAVLGVTVTRFYCCAELRSISVKWLEPAKNQHSCNKGGCCKEKQQFVKVQDSHEGSSFRFDCSTPDILLPVCFDESASYVKAGSDERSLSLLHGPPLRNNTSLYLLFCNYRI